MAKFDLTTKNCEFLDRHLTFPLLEFVLSKDIYDQNVLLNFILETVNRTNMIDYTTEIRKRLNLDESMPEDLVQKRQTVLVKLKELRADIKPLVDCINEIQARETMKDSKMLVNVIQSEYKINIEIVQGVYKFAKYMYDCGNYAETASYLYICLMIMQPSDKNYLNVLWGKLAAEILTLNWQSALEDLNRLREFIDNSSFSSMQLLTQRTWLIHWSILVFFHHPKGRDLIIENLLYKPFYLNVIQTTCPHILRYLSIAVVVNRGRRNALKDLVKVIQLESYAYKDPITEFLEHLYINFDFDGARLKLHECQDVIVNDFFVYGYLDEFVESARLMIFETFCRIHQCITSEMLADKLNMNQEEAECWIVNLIRNARLDAKIDSKLGYVVMGGQQLSPYQQFVEKIDSLTMRSEALTELVERKNRVKNQGENNWKYYNN